MPPLPPPPPPTALITLYRPPASSVTRSTAGRGAPALSSVSSLSSRVPRSSSNRCSSSSSSSSNSRHHSSIGEGGGKRRGRDRFHHDARTLKALTDDAHYRPRFRSTRAVTSATATAKTRSTHAEGGYLPVASFTADDAAVASTRQHVRSNSATTKRDRTPKTMRTIRFTVPSRKRRHTRLQGGARVDRAVHALERAKLTKLLAENKLVKPTSNAPEALLRSIASGVFQC